MAEELQVAGLAVADFEYDLPKELIAQEPLAERDAARLLVLAGSAPARHAHIRDLPDLLRPGDLLVFNRSKVIPARLFGVRARTGGKWEGLFLRTLPDGTWEMLSQTRGYLQDGETLQVYASGSLPFQRGGLGRGASTPLTLQVTGRTQDHHLLVRPDSVDDPFTLLDHYGHVPLPPYIRKGHDQPTDRQRYQTVFAQEPGSVAAPTAGLHFTPALMERLTDAGVAIAYVTLHVGLGTFLPLTAEQLRAGELHEERWEVPTETAVAHAECRQRGGRVIAVGTTSTRTLESAWQDGAVQAGCGSTRLFIRPGYRFNAVDGLLTNFHLPGSSLLMLVAAFAGRERALAAYHEAVAQRYRFFSYGDAMLIVD